MNEPHWQHLVIEALVRAMDLRPDGFWREAKTLDGSIADLVYVAGGHVVVFEMKMAEAGQPGLGLNARARRQLRHFKAAADQVYLVTVASPRRFTLSGDARLVVEEPGEGQLVPDGVGWVMFDQLSLSCTVVKPAATNPPTRADRVFLLDGLESRLGRQRRELTKCRS